MTANRNATAPLPEEDSPTVMLPRLTSLGVENLADMVEHRIERRFNSVSHFVRMVNGGTLCFAYTLA